MADSRLELSAMDSSQTYLKPGFSIRMNTCAGLFPANTPLNAGLGIMDYFGSFLNKLQQRLYHDRTTRQYAIKTITEKAVEFPVHKSQHKETGVTLISLCRHSVN
jgi:hypothetical protein